MSAFWTAILNFLGKYLLEALAGAFNKYISKRKEKAVTDEKLPEYKQALKEGNDEKRKEVLADLINGPE